MKCKKCGATMIYTKESEHKYCFTCPVCLTVSKVKDNKDGK